MKLILLIIFLISVSVRADFNSGIDAAVIAVQYIMADPPMPASDLEKGKYTASVKPGYIRGDTKANYDYGGGATANQTGTIRGGTIAASMTFSISKRLKPYFWLVGTSLEGGFDTKQNGETSPTIFTRNVKVTFLNFSTGFNFVLKNKADNGYNFSFFIGPFFPYYKTSQKYINSPEGIDADLESSHLFAGAMIGAKWDIDFKENWSFSPFIIFGDTFGSKDFFNPFGNSGECKSYKVKKVRSGDSNSSKFGEVDCGNRKEFLFDTQVGGLGLNLHYKPWGLRTNLLAPFINQLILKTFYKDEEPELYYLSFSWDFI